METAIIIPIATLLVGIIVTYIVLTRKHRKDLEILESKNYALSISIVESEAQYKALKNSIEESRLNEDKRMKEQMEALKLAFSESATKLFDEKSHKLSETNEKDIKTILDPLKTQLDEFKKSVEESKVKTIETKISLQEQIKAMMEKTDSISKEANNLANALKGGNKIQGNWGEKHLQAILESAGLVEGIDFELQVTVRDSDGKAIRHDDTEKKLVPDVILKFEEEKVVVIDSKVSLASYLQYCEAITDEQRDIALKKHLESVTTHIKELSKKDYSTYFKRSGKDSLKYVVMFIPNESAFQLFFQNNRPLWSQAFENGVIITGDLYLYTMLKIIRLSWAENKRQKNTEEIMKTAAELVQRATQFINTFDDIGDTFTKTLSKYEDARKKLIGAQSIVTTAKKMEKLGVDCKESIHSMLLAKNEQEDISNQ